jgi:hypothetical protein
MLQAYLRGSWTLTRRMLASDGGVMGVVNGGTADFAPLSSELDLREPEVARSDFGQMSAAGDATQRVCGLLLYRLVPQPPPHHCAAYVETLTRSSSPRQGARLVGAHWQLRCGRRGLSAPLFFAHLNHMLHARTPSASFYASRVPVSFCGR